VPERYVVDPKSGEEILLADGESPTAGLRRRQIEKIEEARSDLARRAATARAKPLAAQPPGTGSTKAGTPTQTVDEAAARSRRIRLGLIAGGVVLVLGIAAIATTSAVSAGIRQQEAAAAEQVRIERLAEREAEEAAADKKAEEQALADALANGREQLDSSSDFATSSASYSTDAQKADLEANRAGLKEALDSNVRADIVVAVEGVKASVKLIGTAEEAAARQVAEAQKGVDDQYLQAAQAAGVSVTDRESALRSAHSYCDSLTSSDQTFEVLVATIHSRQRNDAAISSYCPQFADAAGVASRVFSIGSKVVGTDIAEGTYTTLQKGVKDCYWERSDGGGEIIDNSFISFAPDGVSVTVHNGEGFTTSGCGLWVLQ
jgi:hypothetical protein